MNKIFRLIPVLLLIALAFSTVDAIDESRSTKSSFAKASVLHVIDGDTIKVQMNGKPVIVRMIGVDTPESVHPSMPVQRYSKEASIFLSNLLDGEDVYLKFDSSNTYHFDKYGRLLAYVYRSPDGLFVNLEIIRQGYGHAYMKYPFQHKSIFQYYESRAREIGKGLWDVNIDTGVCTP